MAESPLFAPSPIGVVYKEKGQKRRRRYKKKKEKVENINTIYDVTKDLDCLIKSHVSLKERSKSKRRLVNHKYKFN